MAERAEQGKLEGLDLDPPACAWWGTVGEFLQVDDSSWSAAIADGYQAMTGRRSTATHRQSWDDCRAWLVTSLLEARETSLAIDAWTLVFEYEIPWEGGRRPDLVVLADRQILVLEFKQAGTIEAAALDQVADYTRDLRLYHRESRDRIVHPALVLTRLDGERIIERRGVPVIPPRGLAQVWVDWPRRSTPDEAMDPETLGASSVEPIDPQRWLDSEYAPLPSIVQAARRLFLEQPLPEIRRAASAGLPQASRRLEELAERVRTSGGHHVALVTGVPGSGKTLLGLQVVHQQALRDGSDHPNSLFLSGNGPLVEVLQYALQSKAFVRPIRNFYLQHEVKTQKPPPGQIIIFDEAQRAWDSERMGEKYGVSGSAQRVILRIASRLDAGALVVGLIGEGQEIHVGEEGGLTQWADALRNDDLGVPWTLHIPERLHPVFHDLPEPRREGHPELDLDVSIRSHRAARIQDWITALLAGDLEGARTWANQLVGQDFRLDLTRDLEQAKNHARARYADAPEKTYGLIASSQARNLPEHGIRNDYPATRRVALGPWFVDPADSSRSCRVLRDVATEFGCQGLELDLPIVAWGNDLTWDDKKTAWKVRASRQKQVRDPETLRLNSYRVLLSRGRDGLVLFVPPDPKMDSTAQALQDAGVRPLERSD